MCQPHKRYEWIQSFLIHFVSKFVIVIQNKNINKHQHCQLLGLKFNKYEYFLPTWSCESR